MQEEKSHFKKGGLAPRSKKGAYILVAAIAFSAAYLYLTHAYIYHILRQGGLKSVEWQHSYPIYNGMDGNKKIYAALGDSLTSGVGTDDYRSSYPHLLAEKISGTKGPVILDVFAYPGAKTGDLIKDLLSPAIADQPDILTLMIGTNDIHGGVSQSEFRQNYAYILSKLANETKAEIYAISIPYIGSDSLYFWPWEGHIARQTEIYNGIVKELAELYGVKFIDFSPDIRDLSKKDGDHYSKDKFHPSAIGYEIWAGLIYEHFNK